MDLTYRSIDCLKDTVIYPQLKKIIFDCFAFLKRNRLLRYDNTYQDIEFTLTTQYSNVQQLRYQLNRVCNTHYRNNPFAEILFMINEMVTIIDNELYGNDNMKNPEIYTTYEPPKRYTKPRYPIQRTYGTRNIPSI